MKEHMYSAEPANMTKPEIPAKTHYECDVLVIGGGFAGLMAAVTAAESGRKVVLIDKGRPGYSGQTPFAGCTRWFDPERGDDKDALLETYIRGSQYAANQNWVNVWIEESKPVYEKLCDLGIFEKFENAEETGHIKTNDFVGYMEFAGKRDRHSRFVPILKSRGVEVVERTMICDVVVENGKAVGAVGFHVPSGTIISCSAKATVMCMGGGVYKPAGWPTCGISYESVAIAYKLGIPVIGQEFEDYHVSMSNQPSNAFIPPAWAYLQPMVELGGEINSGNIKESVIKGGSTIKHTADKVSAAIYAATPDLKPRREMVRPGAGKTDAYGCAAGFGMHTTNGIYCGSEDTVGFTGIPGLYCAGDGCNAGPVGGASYAGKPGFTSNFCAVQGKRAGAAAAEYCDNAELRELPKAALNELEEEMKALLERERGFSADWALDCLQGIMAPMWTIVLKNEPCLKAALVQVEYIRDNILPKLKAENSHDLRYCIELKNKVLEAEMKLRASLARKESRGGHYRSDFPYRDDENFLCYFGAFRGSDGMEIREINYPEHWKGDLNESYAERYMGAYYPGEEEAVREMGWI